MLLRERLQNKENMLMYYLNPFFMELFLILPSGYISCETDDNIDTSQIEYELQ